MKSKIDEKEYLEELKNYVKLVDLNFKDQLSKATIGILLCRDAAKTVVKTTLEDETSPLVLSKYILLDDLMKI